MRRGGSTPVAATEDFFLTGGTMSRDAVSYVVRSADTQLYECLTRREYCYILTSRQLGKSSLMVRAAAQMEANGTAVFVVQLPALGQNVTIEQWYGGFIDRIAAQFDLEDEVEEFWENQAHVGAFQRWVRAIREIILPRLDKRPLVIFIDEIDFTRSLPFSTDEFFAGIRECHSRRLEDPEFERLTFCLVGVARPVDLMRDLRVTPFNIGQRIELADFSLDEAMALARGLRPDQDQARKLLERIFHWTNGHPYLTQVFCREVARDPKITSARDIDARCYELFLSARARDNDDNLVFVRNRVLKTEEDLAGVLDLYGRVLRGKRIKSQDNNPLISILRLAGITRLVGEHLVVRNRIYHYVFDRKWVDANMPDQEKRRQKAAVRRARIRIGIPAIIVVAVVGGLAGYALREKAHVTEVLDLAHKSNGQFLMASQYTGLSKATQELVVKPALEQLPRLEEAAPNNWGVVFKVADGYDAIGNLQLKMVDMEIGTRTAAKDSIEKALAIRLQLQQKKKLVAEEEMALSQTYHNLGRVTSVPNPNGSISNLVTDRDEAAGNFSKALEIRKRLLGVHKADAGYAVPAARTLIAIGKLMRDYSRELPEDQNKGTLCGFKTPSECFEAALACVSGLSSPAGKMESNDDAATDHPEKYVEMVRSSASIQLAMLDAENPDKLDDAVKQLQAAAKESSERAEAYAALNKQNKADRDGMQMALDAAGKLKELGKCEAKAGNLTQAIDSLKPAVDILNRLKELAPVNLDVRTTLAEVYEIMTPVYSAQSNCQWALEKSKLAVQERLVAHELNPGSTKARDFLAQAYILQGDALFRAKGVRDADASYQQAIDVYPRDPGPYPIRVEARHERGIALQAMARFDDAQSQFEQAGIELKAIEVQLQSDEARSGFEKPEIKAARQASTRSKAKVLAALANNWALQNENHAALGYYNQAIEIQSRLADVNPNDLEERIELAANIVRRAAVVGALGLQGDATHDCEGGAELLNKLAKWKVRGSTPVLDNAGLLELLVVAKLDLARAWIRAHEWRPAFDALEDARELSDSVEHPNRETGSVVGTTSDVEAMGLRAEVCYHLSKADPKRKPTHMPTHLRANAPHGATGQMDAADWLRSADQWDAWEKAYQQRDRKRDMDNARYSAQFTIIYRFAGLAHEALWEENTATNTDDPRQADRFLKDALQFRRMTAIRTYTDGGGALGVVTSFNDLGHYLCNEADDMNRVSDDTVNSLERLIQQFTPDDEKTPSKMNAKLNWQMALIYIQKTRKHGKEAQDSLDDATKTANRIKEAFPDSYPDALARWTEFKEHPDRFPGIEEPDLPATRPMAGP